MLTVSVCERIAVRLNDMQYDIKPVVSLPPSFIPPSYKEQKSERSRKRKNKGVKDAQLAEKRTKN